jgi:hypothetical protein
MAKARASKGWTTTLRRLASPAFGRPFSCIGVLFLIQQWGEFNNLLIHMIEIFRESKTSVETELAPVIVGSIQVQICSSYFFLLSCYHRFIVFNNFKHYLYNECENVKRQTENRIIV